MWSEIVCSLKRFDFTYMSIVSLCCYSAFRYGYTSPACSNSAQDFSVPQTFMRLRSMSREVFSRHGSTVSPGSITIEPKISCYAFQSQNLDKPASFMGVQIEKTLD